MIVGEGFCQVWCDNVFEFIVFSVVVMLKIVVVREIFLVLFIVDGEYFICVSCLLWFYFILMIYVEYVVGVVVFVFIWGKLQNGVILVVGWFNYVFVDGFYVSCFYVFVEEGFNDFEWFWLLLIEIVFFLLFLVVKEC